MEVGNRCEVTIGKRRGEVKYVGQIAKLGKGFWVGVQLDEPSGNSDGKIDGESFFDCPANYGLFIRPKELAVGDYPEIDEFGDDDEI